MRDASLRSGRHASHYEILEVSPNASPEVIRAAYRSLMQRYHPDKNPDDNRAAERAVQVVQAYEVLSDADRRAAYDLSLSSATIASPSAASAWGDTESTESQRPRTARKKSSASLGILLLASALIIAACWVLITAVWQMVSPRSPTPAANESPPAAKPAAAERNRLSRPPGGLAVRPSPPSPLRIHPQNTSLYPQYNMQTNGSQAMPDAAQGSANRGIPALIANFSVALRNPRNPGETTGYQLEIPAIAVRLGGDQTASARNHLGNMSEPIRKALETQLELADYDKLMTFDGDSYLARHILAVIVKVAGLPVCASDAGQNADDCYGLVAVSLPESYIVK